MIFASTSIDAEIAEYENSVKKKQCYDFRSDPGSTQFNIYVRFWTEMLDSTLNHIINHQ